MGEEWPDQLAGDARGGRPANLQRRVVRLDGLGRRLVKLQILLARARPHHADLRLVPYLKVPDIVLESVGPAVVVVADDVDADPGPLGKVPGRVVVVVGPRLDALAQPPDDLALVLHNGRDVVVGLGESVVLRVVGIRIEDGEDRGDIHRVGTWPVDVVQSRVRERGFGVVNAQVGVLADGERPVANAVKGFDLAERFGEGDGDVGLGVGGVRCCGHEKRQDSEYCLNHGRPYLSDKCRNLKLG